MIFRLNPSGGQPIYLQLMRQIQHAVETGVLKDGDVMPGIRTLAEELTVSHNTVAKAYTELEHQGLLDLRHGSGAYISVKRKVLSRTDTVRWAQEQVREFIARLREEGLADEEIRLLCEAELLYERPVTERAGAGRKR
ncbi:MAG TPA: GntR family transcriptional regulator [Bryobacteraceae bacterium]|jgi:GntR family transcriptional regulator